MTCPTLRKEDPPHLPRACARVPFLSPRKRLSDSHIVTDQGSAVLDGVELDEADAHDLGARLAVVAGPSAEAGDDPGREGKGALGVRIALSRGPALEPDRDSFADGLIGRLQG